MEEQPPTQSPLISTSGGGLPASWDRPEPPPQHQDSPEEEDEDDDDPENRRPWEEDDFGDSEVLDLVKGGDGGFKHPPYSVDPPRPPVSLQEHGDGKKPEWGAEREASGSSPSSSPEEYEDVPPDRRPTAPAITPLAPLAPASPSKEEAVSRRGPSGSVDETLFALPAASASLMHSSADNIDLQEQPFSSVSPGQEDLASLLHESSASLTSLSPLATYPVQEHTFTDSALGMPSFTGALQEPVSPMYLESTTINETTASRGDLTLHQTEIQPPSPLKPEAFTADHTEDEKPYSEETKRAVALFDEPSKGWFSETQKSGQFGPPPENAFQVAFGEESPVRADYVDFKPFAPVLDSKVTGGEKSSFDDLFKSGDGGIYEVDTKVTTPQPSYEMDEASSPSESEQDLSQSYLPPTTFQTSAAADDVTPLPPLHDLISENKTDEKKIAEMEAHWSTEPWGSSVSTTSAFSVACKAEEPDYGSAVALTGVPDSLTPDLVQEAYESKMHDAAGAQLTCTSKIDLVQTSESVHEPLLCAGPIFPSFQSPESVHSPVLPDIVMEAPVNTGEASLETTSLFITESDLSPLEDIAPVVHEEQIKLESEKPPSYEEVVKEPLTQVQKDSIDGFDFKEYDRAESTVLEEIETPYISIACDLIKETKISNEFLPPGFTDFSTKARGDFSSQSVPLKKDEDSSSESEEIDFYRHCMPEVKKEVTETLTTSGLARAVEDISCSIVGDESKNLGPDLSQGNVYMESFEPEWNLSKNTTDSLLDEPTVAVSSKGEKPLQLKELGKGIQLEQGLSAYQEHKLEEAPWCTAKHSPVPITEDSLTILAHPKAAKLASEELVNGEERKAENESMRNVTEMEASPVSFPEIPCAASANKVPVKTEEMLQSHDYLLDIHKVSDMRPPPKQSLPSNRVDLFSAIKPEELEKVVDPEHSSIKEKGERERIAPPVVAASVLSARLGKRSVVDLLYWRDIKKTGVVFGASLFLLLSLTVFSIVSVSAYIALALLSVTISYRIYKGVFQAIQKSDEGHPFRAYLESDVAVSEELVQKYSNVALSHVNCTVKELRRLFLVEDLVDSLKFAVLMWVFTYVGALFNGLTLLILALVSLFSIPVIYERRQSQIDHYVGLVNKNFKDAVAKIQAKIPGLKRKAE